MHCPLEMANWWKCKIARPSMMIPFSKGEIIYAKNGDDSITLFDGRQESRVPKSALKYLQLLSRLPNADSRLIQGKYEQKKAAKATWDMPNLPES
jgi:hypothetical protein